MPLTWAHSEYIKLSVSLKNRKVYDMPRQTRERYVKAKTGSTLRSWRFDRMPPSLERGRTLRIEVQAKATVHWTEDGWEQVHTIETSDPGLGIFIADIAPGNPEATEIEFTFYWPEAARWENRNFSVAITGENPVSSKETGQTEP